MRSRPEMMSVSCTISQCEQTMANGQWQGPKRANIVYCGERGSPKNRSQEWRFYELQTLSISPFSGHRRLDSKRPTTSNTMHFYRRRRRSRKVNMSSGRGGEGGWREEGGEMESWMAEMSMHVTIVTTCDNCDHM